MDFAAEEALPRIGSAGELEALMAEMVSTGMPANDSSAAEMGTERSITLTPILQAEQYQRPDALGDQGCIIHALARQKQRTRSGPARSELTRLYKLQKAFHFLKTSQVRAPAGADVHLVN